MAGHIGRIPNYGKSQVNPMGNVEPPACIQNAMMTKDKKPFTYTPGGLDLSQIRTPSMARRMARQRSLEEQEQAYAPHNSGGNNYHPQGGPVPPPPPPSQIPAPPPPPPLVIETPQSKSPKPIAPGERPEIVIPENPICMLRKTNSPYHWEAEQAELQRLGAVPKFQEKVPSPLTVKMPPSTFSQQPPQTYSPQVQNSHYSYANQNKQPESPILRPEAQYANPKSNSPNVNGSPLTRELLQRQDSQFNKSPQPFGAQSPISNGSPYSPTPSTNWRQPERRDSPANKVSSPQSPYQNRSPYSPSTQQYSPSTQQYSPSTQQNSPNYQNQSSPRPVFHTLPKTGLKHSDNNYGDNTPENNVLYNNVAPAPQSPKVDSSNPTPWRTNRIPKEQDELQAIYHNSQNRNQQSSYTPPWVSGGVNQNSQVENNQASTWNQENKAGYQQQQHTPRLVQSQDANNNRTQENYSPPWRSNANNDNRGPPSQIQSQGQPRYQSTISIPVAPRQSTSQTEQNSGAPQKEAVYVNQEPVYYCPESPKSLPPWVKTQKEKTKTPPPIWCQRPLEARKSLSRELVTPPRESNQEPEWVKKSSEFQRGVREVISPPKYQQPVQPTWSTIPSENRKSLPKDNVPTTQGAGTRVIPIQMEVSNVDSRNQGRQDRNQQPPLRTMINVQQPPNAQSQPNQAPFTQPTQRIMRVLSPQLVRLDDASSQHELPTLNTTFKNNQNQSQQPKTRIIPIQIEGGNDGGNKRIYYHKFNQEGPPRQSKAFRVLQVITGTQDTDDIQNIESRNGFTDL